MKKFLAIVITVLFCGCATKNIPSASIQDSIYVEKIVPIYIEPDSSIVEAMIKCNEDNIAYIANMRLMSSKNIELSFQLDSLGRLKSKSVFLHDTIYVRGANKTMTKTVTIEKEVPAKLSSWDSFLIKYGIFWIGATVALLGYTIFSIVKKLKL